MSFSESVRTVYSKYAIFSGRATRSEYWWFVLFYVLVFVIGYGVAVAAVVASRSYALFAIFALAILVFTLVSFVPAISVMVRRLHDTDRSGWWFWIQLIPYIGSFILLVILALEGTRGYNRYGPPAGAPPADGYAEYSGWTRAEALARFSEDAQRAAASGFQPVTQDWDQRGNVEVLRVWYARMGPTGWPTPPGVPPGPQPGFQPYDPPPPGPEPPGSPPAGTQTGGGLG